MPEVEPVGACNLFPYAMFSSTELTIDGQKITWASNNNFQHYLSYAQIATKMSEVDRQKILAGAFYIKDDPARASLKVHARGDDGNKFITSFNEGLLTRANKIRLSATNTTLMPVLFDFHPKFGD